MRFSNVPTGSQLVLLVLVGLLGGTMFKNSMREVGEILPLLHGIFIGILGSLCLLLCKEKSGREVFEYCLWAMFFFVTYGFVISIRS